VLADRVSKIEELLLAKNEKRTFLGKDNQNTLQKVTSIHDLMRNSRKKTAEKAKYDLRNTGCESTRRDETARKSKYS
jgi:hypothetical protein